MTIKHAVQVKAEIDRCSITFSISRVLLEQPWFGETLVQLLDLLLLDDNWNGYGESAIEISSIKRAVNVLDVVGKQGRQPGVVPTMNGGVQLEWIGNGFEIEIEVPPTGPAEVQIVDPANNEEEYSIGSRSSRWGQLRETISNMAANQE